MELYALTREQLENRLLGLHKAAIELVKEMSIDVVLEKIASIALERVSASFAAVGVVNEIGTLEKFIPVGMTRAEIDQIPHPPVGIGLIGELSRSKTSIRIADITKDPRRSGFPAFHPKMTTFLGVPIRQGQRQLGQIYLTNKSGGGEFTKDDQILIEILASYAAIAIDNARLYRDLSTRDKILTRRNENLDLLNKMASSLATSTDIDEILANGLDQLMGYLRLEAAEIYLKQEETRVLTLLVHRGAAVKKLWKRDQYKFNESTVGRSAASGQRVVLNLTENEYIDINPEAKPQGLHQLAVVPLIGRKGVVGVLCVATTHPQPLEEPDLQFVQAISAWMATAVENVRLNIQGRRLAILEERERIGMDLHDGIIQSIFAVGLTLEHARLLMKENPTQATSRIEQAVSDLNGTIRDIRAYILDLRPRQLNNENLMQGIQRLVREFRANTLVDVNLKGPEDGVASLPEPQAEAMFHICQEALANIAKHAKAKRVDVVVWTTAERALLEISDDGRGFDMEKVKLTIGHGLSNMETRAVNAGGDVDITSEQGRGTTVLAWVPFPEPESPIIE